MTGWRAVHDVMMAARLEGPHASQKGLRHGFGVAVVSAGIPLSMVQKWLDMLSSPRRRFMPTLSVLRGRISPAACGAE